MKLKRLHLLLIFIALAIGGYYGYTWYQNQAAQAVKPAPLEPAPPAAPSPADSLVSPKAVAPVKTAPKVVTPKTPSMSVTSSSSDTSYTVVKGDTLWRIAEVQSPVHQGPGWVTIWQANKTTVKNFDRLEVGWNLTIPSTPRDYVMPYWRPRDLASASRPTHTYVVDLRQLPTGAESVLVDLQQLPSAAESVLVDLKQLPSADEVDLAALPTSPEMALASADPEGFTTAAFPWPIDDHFGRPDYH